MQSDQLLWLLTAVTMGITLLLSVLVISVHTRKMGQQLSEIGVLRRSVQEMQPDFAEDRSDCRSHVHRPARTIRFWSSFRTDEEGAVTPL
jgi:hypothetical protein